MPFYLLHSPRECTNQIDLRFLEHIPTQRLALGRPPGFPPGCKSELVGGWQAGHEDA